MKKVLLYGFLLCFLVGAAGLGIAGWELYRIDSELPEFTSLKDYHPPVITQVYDRNGEVFATFSKERRTVISRAQMPDRLIKAFMGAEDAGFYEHSGIAVNGVVAAALAEARRRAHLMFPSIIPNGRKRGGSTITQQLVKTFLLTPEKTYRRKIKEMLLAVRIEQALTKDEILFLYLNQIYFGNGAYGVEEAAKTYFGKHVGSLTLAECATLASMPKAPNEINPIANPARTLERRAYVLKQMETHGFAKPADVAAALQEPLPKSRAVSEFMGKAPYAAEEVRRYLVAKYGEELMYRDGLIVRTTFDANACEAAQSAVTNGVLAVDERAKWTGPLRTQGALVAIDTESRQVIALVGGAKFEQGINRATQAKRQPGSSFKPFIYAEAIASKQYTAATIMNDVPRLYEDALVDENGEKKDYTPENHGGKYRGDVTIRAALTDSINTVSFALLEALTPKRIVQSVRALGLGGEWKERDINLSLALGTGLVTPLELTNAYVTFADEGRYAKPVMILQVAKLDGTVLEQASLAKTQVMDRGVAYVMLSIMKSVVETGTAQRVRELRRPVAGKTGTTNFSKDAWFVGCVPGLCTGVWVGQDDAKPMGKDEFGGRAAAPIFVDFNRAVLAGTPVRDFIQPEGVVMQRINPANGQLSDPMDENEEIEEVFLEGTGPNAAPIATQ